MPVNTLTIRSWKQLEKYSERKLWLFRGMRVGKWPLMSSIERCLNWGGIARWRRPFVEEGLMREFRRACHHYTQHVPDEGRKVELLALMQHHGAPTRLLDFTYSIYNAVYFALADLDPNEDLRGNCAVWAVNGRWALKESANLLELGGKDPAIVEHCVAKCLFEEDREVSNEELFFKEPMVRLACPINTYRLNERLRTQKGIFLIAGTVCAPFMDNLEAMPGHDNAENLVKLLIPNSKRNEFIEKLFRTNVSHTSLFPGLDGFAKSLGVHSPAYHANSWIRRVSGVWEAA